MKDLLKAMGKNRKPRNTPLGSFLQEIEEHRGEAIYNTTHRYIKEIIWDDEKNKKYGDTREGYERYKRDSNGYMSYSGVVSLREETDKDNNIIGYMTEQKRQTNEPLKEIQEIYDRAVDKFCELVGGSSDSKVLKWWLDDNIHRDTQANTYMYGVKSLEEYLDEYSWNEEFKEFIDKIK